MRIRPPKLSTRLLLLVLAASLPGIALVAVLAFSHRRSVLDDAEARAYELTSLLVASQESALQSTGVVLAALAPLVDQLLADGGDCAGTLAALLARDRRLANLGIVSGEGRVLCSALPVNDTAVVNRGWIADAIASNEVAISEHIMGIASRRPVVVVVHPQRTNGGDARVIAGSIDLNALVGLLAAAPIPTGTVITLIDSAGAVITRYPDPEAWVGRGVRDEPLARAALSSPGGTARLRGLDGVERFYAFLPMPGPPASDARLAVGIPMDDTLARADQALWRSLLTLMIVLLIALVLSRFTAQRLIMKPAEILVNAADRMRAGDLSARVGIPMHSEVGRVGAAFDAMAARVEAQTAELARSREQMRQLARRTEEHVERERRRIARAVHDDLGQALTALKLDTSWIAQRVNGEDAAIREHLEGMQELLEKTSASVRRISTELRPSVLDDLGLDAAVEWQAQEFTRRTGITADVRLDVRPGRRPGQTGIALFRILQEALTNIARHAEARRVVIALVEEPGRISLEVTDDGIGIDAAPDGHPSLGLLGMRERAEALAGTFTAEPASPRGTTIRAEIPIDDSAPDTETQ